MSILTCLYTTNYKLINKILIMKSIRIFSVFSAVALFFTIVACKKNTPAISSEKTSTTARAVTANFKVIGYMPTWWGNVSDIQFSKLTHVNYAFLLPTTNGGYNPIENPSKLSSLVAAAHANNVKAIISVGGGGGGDAFNSIITTAAKRTNFVNNMIAFTDQYNLDGVDVDWEFPNASQANNFLLLMQELANAMHSRGKLASIAVIAYNDGNSIASGMFSALDYIQVMAYDENNYTHSTFDVAVQSVNYWKNRGCPAEKVILGVPFYGRDNRVDYGTMNYNVILNNGGSANSDTWTNFGYNGIPTIKAKTNWAWDNAGGMMIWELSGDATGSNSLLSAMNQTIVSRQSGGTTIPIGKVISLKGNNNKFVCGENGTSALICNRATAGSWEKFTVLDAGNGKVALRSMSKYVSSENGVSAMMADRTSINDWEKFDWISNSDGTVSLRGNNGMYVSSENGTQGMNCNRPNANVNSWERFTAVIY
jgi:GH18 family chitinase